MKRTVAALAVAALLMAGATSCPRDPHPERMPSPSPWVDHPLRTGRQPAPTR